MNLPSSAAKDNLQYIKCMIPRSFRRLMRQPAEWVFLCCTLLASTEVAAWSATGHELTCEVAAAHLTKAAMQEAKQLMQALPVAQQEALYDDGPFTFADLCTWADKVRPLKAYAGVSAWHYVNVDRTDETVNLNRCATGCILTAIKTHSDLLADKRNAAWTRLQALMFLSHWVGDIHQPMHVSFADDYGGNRTRVGGFEGCDNMHGVWDYCLIRDTGKDSAALLSELLALPFADEAISHEPMTWAQESFELAIHPRTQYCRKQNGSCQPWATRRYQLDASYQAMNWPVAERRLALAGHRLAGLLNTLLADTVPSD